jgi:hypothetical protein
VQASVCGERAAGWQDVAGCGAAAGGGRPLLPAGPLDRGRLEGSGASQVGTRARRGLLDVCGKETLWRAS